MIWRDGHRNLIQFQGRQWKSTRRVKLKHVITTHVLYYLYQRLLGSIVRETYHTCTPRLGTLARLFVLHGRECSLDPYTRRPGDVGV